MRKLFKETSDLGVWLHGQAVKTSPFHGGNTGSIPVGVINADVAQLAEQLICNQQVIGSSPIIGFYTISYCIYGQIPEWPKGTDCKSAANCFGGSNPPPPIHLSNIRCKKLPERPVFSLPAWRNWQTHRT